MPADTFTVVSLSGRPVDEATLARLRKQLGEEKVEKSAIAFPQATFIGADEPEDWRAILADEPDDDEELDVTPPEVVAMLGFDPLEFSEEPVKKFNDVHDERGRFASSSGSGEFIGEGDIPSSSDIDNWKKLDDNYIRQMAVGSPASDRAVWLKQQVEKDLQDRLSKLSLEDRAAYDAFTKVFTLRADDYPVPLSPEEQLVHSWASTSLDNNPTAMVLQAAAKKEFNLTGATLDHAGEHISEQYGEWVVKPEADLQMKGARVFLRTMYNQTQDFYAKNGVTEVTVFRGLGLPQESVTAEMRSALDSERVAVKTLTLRMQPMSSFSTNVNTAANFVGSKDDMYPMILAAKIPVSKIIATPRTGFGCVNESEVVVLGGVTKMHAVFSYNQENFFDDTESMDPKYIVRRLKGN
jgi:hypothetical protein